MENLTNRQIRLAKRPEGKPGKDSFEITESPVPEFKKGEMLIENIYVSVDPYMRGRMGDPATFPNAFKINDVIRGRTIGRVLESRSDSFKQGEYVMSMKGWEEYSVARDQDVQKLDPDAAPLSAYLGVAGMTGLTAYFGLLEIGRPKAGETVVVTAAAGAVGNVVGQIAKIKGCRVTGICGSDEKVSLLKDKLHFDEAINYRKTGNLAQDLKNACPDGVDVYFDNVGGEISDAVLLCINRYARIPVCGQISLYNSTEEPVGPRVQPVLLSHAAMMQGYTVSDYSARFPEAVKQIGDWLRQRKLVTLENIVNGFEHIPDAFIGLFNGENTGKQVVRLK